MAKRKKIFKGTIEDTQVIGNKYMKGHIETVGRFNRIYFEAKPHEFANGDYVEFELHDPNPDFRGRNKPSIQAKIVRTIRKVRW